jgi:hypothetical protein
MLEETELTDARIPRECQRMFTKHSLAAGPIGSDLGDGCFGRAGQGCVPGSVGEQTRFIFSEIGNLLHADRRGPRANVGVSALIDPRLLVEVGAVAVLPPQDTEGV